MLTPRSPWLKRGSTAFLQTVVVLIGIGVLGLLLWEPQIEGRNANATQFEIYFTDPFLAFAYVGSIPFFVALFRAFAMLGEIRRRGTFSRATVKGLRTIKRCAIVVLGFVAVGELFIVFGHSDDRAGGVFMGLLFAVGSIVAAAVAAMGERRLRDAMDMTSEGDRTI